MRALPLLLTAALLSGCFAPALLLPSPGQLMWALLKPMVGLDPNAVGLFDQPLVRERMTALLGARYDTVVGLLQTADALQQEGPLFFVVSRYTPVPQLAQKAGLVWNADTNQMAVALLEGDVVKVFSERATRAAQIELEGAGAAADAALAEVVPVWPAVMQSWVRGALPPPS